MRDQSSFEKESDLDFKSVYICLFEKRVRFRFYIDHEHIFYYLHQKY
jgi:hypothetical protein